MKPTSKALQRWNPARRFVDPKPRLGEILRRSNLVDESKLMEAVFLGKQTGDRVGDVLIARGQIGYYDLYHAIAEQHQLPFIDLIETPPDASLLRKEDISVYLRIGAIPWREQDGHIIIAACELSTQVMGWVTPRYGDRAKIFITSPLDIRRAVELHFGSALEHSSRLSLWERAPHASARITMFPTQQKILYTGLGMALAMVLMHPIKSLLVFILLCHGVYCLTMLFKARVFAEGMCGLANAHWDEKLATLLPRHLPVYTILIPMYKEAESLPGILAAMQNLDYPPSKLDIKLLLEMDDEETLHAALALKPRYQFEILRVPPGTPRTKPRACNYALHFARGEFVTIFDAEDRPEPQQLKKAVYTFRNCDPDVACLQAPLNYYNANENWLTRFFSLEYTILFQFMLRGLERLRIPIPLGGTSNHIALARIRQSGAWDPYNVTEDADLGARLAAHGFRTVILDSYTMEEAPVRTRPWVKQRSRWIKGYMQTWLVHMRHPVALYRALGSKSFIGFQCFIGLSSLTFLTAPVVWAASLLWAFGAIDTSFLPRSMAALTLVNLYLNICTQWLFALAATRLYRNHSLRMTLSALLYPLYLVLHSIASYKALWQLIRNPHFWEKTTHGITRHIDQEALKEGLF